MGPEASATWQRVATWSPVVAVAVLSQTGIGLESAWSGSVAGLAVTSVLLAGPLLVRTVRPVLAAVLVGSALVVQVELGGSLHFASFITVLVASYAAGRHAAARRAPVGVGALLLGVVVAMRHSFPGTAVELVFPLFYVTAAAVLGSVVRRQSRQAAELRGLNEALVREREALDRLVLATERLRLARELHDVVAHTLTVTVIQAQACEDALEDEPERARQAVRQVQAAGRRGLADLRSLVRVLRDADAPSDDAGLDDLDALAAVMTGAGLEVAITREGKLPGLASQLEHELYRIAQEALTNVVKHSTAVSATLALRRVASCVELEVVDPGPAVREPVPPGGHGLSGMQERLAPFDGEVLAGPHLGGFRVLVRVPLHKKVPA